LTLIVLELTLLAVVVGYAIARGHTLLHQAQGIVLAGIVRTDEDLLLAVDARIAHGTGAGVGRQFVHTDASVLAGRRGALVDLLLANPTVPARRTVAGELQTRTLDALAAMLATGSSSCRRAKENVEDFRLKKFYK